MLGISVVPRSPSKNDYVSFRILKGWVKREREGVGLPLAELVPLLFELEFKLLGFEEDV